MSRQSAARACRRPASASRAWKISAFTLSFAHVEGGRDLLVREVAQLGEHQRRALVVGQPGDIAEDLAEVLATLDVGGRGAGRTRLAHVVECDLVPPRAKHRQAAVPGDRVQPRLELHAPVALTQMAVGGDEHVLERVLGLLARAQHVLAEAEQCPVMAVIDRLERTLVAAPEAHGPVVRLRQHAASP